MGTATASSASESTSPGIPQASLPNSQAVGCRSQATGIKVVERAPGAAVGGQHPQAGVAQGGDRRGAAAHSSPPGRGTGCRPRRARTCCCRGQPTPRRRSRPGHRRRPRSAGPCLRSPGHARSPGRPRGGGAAAVTWLSGTSTNRQTARMPCGVTVCASSAMTSPLTRCTRTPCPAASSDDLAVAGLRGRGDEQLRDHASGGQRLARRLRALGQERPGALPERPLGQLPGRLDPGGTDAGELGAGRRRHARPPPPDRGGVRPPRYWSGPGPCPPPRGHPWPPPPERRTRPGPRRRVRRASGGPPRHPRS